MVFPAAADLGSRHDLNPVAATDTAGRIWLAWQGYRDGNLEILAAAQQGDSFSGETVVSFSQASDWDPSIAAAPNGDIAISWDTYDKGDYDVYFRRLRFGQQIQMDDPVTVAASPKFEARSSAAFDAQNRLWVAYEVSGTRWGKNFGAYDTTGIALYQGHNIEIACFQGNQKFTPAADLARSLPGPASGAMFPRKLGPGAAVVWPNPDAAANRKPGGGPGSPAQPLNSFPRLATDSDGKIYLAYRNANGNGTTSIGSIWHEEIVYFDGAAWSAPILAPNSDALLDNRPALVPMLPPTPAGVSARTTASSQSPGTGQATINSDLYAAEVRLSHAAQALKLTAAPPGVTPPPDTRSQAEDGQIAAMRNARASVGGQNFQLMRGEFHRHTEISSDGGHDGPADRRLSLHDRRRRYGLGRLLRSRQRRRPRILLVDHPEADRRLSAATASICPMFAYERSVRYPEGHRNVVFARRGIRPLPRLPVTAADSAPTHAPDTQMLYRYLRQFDGIAASHTSGTDMGTDWRDNDPSVEPVVEIYQGDRQNYEMPGAPRTNSADDSIGGWRPLGFVSLALEKGYRLGFQASSDHISTHMSYCNLWVKDTDAGRHHGGVPASAARYGSTDNILADVRCGRAFHGRGIFARHTRHPSK